MNDHLTSLWYISISTYDIVNSISNFLSKRVSWSFHLKTLRPRSFKYLRDIKEPDSLCTDGLSIKNHRNKNTVPFLISLCTWNPWVIFPLAYFLYFFSESSTICLSGGQFQTCLVDVMVLSFWDLLLLTLISNFPLGILWGIFIKLLSSEKWNL